MRALLLAALCALLFAPALAQAPAGDPSAVVPAIPTPAAAADARFEALARRYTGEFAQRDPLFADGIGIHAFDDALPDYSAPALAERRRWQESWKAQIAAVDATLLSPGANADRTGLLDAIELELYEDGTIDPWSTNPGLYVDALGNAVYALTSRRYAPADERYRHVAARLPLVPAFVDAAIANLKRPAQVVTQFAVDDNAGNVDMYRDLSTTDGDASPETRALIAARAPAAVAALQRFQKFLAGPLLARSDGNPRVGAAVYDRELVLSAGTDASRADLLRRARAAMSAARAEMLRLALPLDAQYFPNGSRDGTGDALIDGVVGRVLNRLAGDHPQRDQVFATARADLASVEGFLTAHPVVVLPVPDTLSVVPTPAFMAGFSGASADPAGTFTPLAESYYYIDEIPKSWSRERVDSYLRENNDYEMKMLTMHEAVPGHYVEFRYNNQLPSIVRRVFGNGSFVEGWAVWGEGMMLERRLRRQRPAPAPLPTQVAPARVFRPDHRRRVPRRDDDGGPVHRPAAARGVPRALGGADEVAPALALARSTVDVLRRPRRDRARPRREPEALRPRRLQPPPARDRQRRTALHQSLL